MEQLHALLLHGLPFIGSGRAAFQTRARPEDHVPAEVGDRLKLRIEVRPRNFTVGKRLGLSREGGPEHDEEKESK